MNYASRLLKDDDISIHYHPSKTNIFVVVLSKLSIESSDNAMEGKKKLFKEVHQLARLGVRLCNNPCLKKGNDSQMLEV